MALIEDSGSSAKLNVGGQEVRAVAVPMVKAMFLLPHATHSVTELRYFIHRLGLTTETVALLTSSRGNIRVCLAAFSDRLHRPTLWQ